MVVLLISLFWPGSNWKKIRNNTGNLSSAKGTLINKCSRVDKYNIVR